MNGDILMGVQDPCSRHPAYSKRLHDGILRAPKVRQHVKVPVTEPATVDSETEVSGRQTEGLRPLRRLVLVIDTCSGEDHEVDAFST